MVFPTHEPPTEAPECFTCTDSVFNVGQVLARRCGARYGEQTYTKSKNDRRTDPRGEMPPSHCGLPHKDENAPGLSNARRGSLLAVLSQLLVTLPPILPKLSGGKQRNDCGENEMPVPERASFCVTKDEW